MKKYTDMIHSVTRHFSVIDWFVVKVLLVGMGILIGITFERYFAPFMLLKILVVVTAWAYVVVRVIRLYDREERL